MFGFANGHLPDGYEFDDDGAVVPSLAMFGIGTDASALVALVELHELAMAS